jgi:hypothetical protein
MTPEQRTTLNSLWRSRSRMMDVSRRDAIRAALNEIDALRNALLNIATLPATRSECQDCHAMQCTADMALESKP